MTINDFATKIKTLKSALIISHDRPDGDTIGSAIALKLALLSLNIDADVCCDSPIPEKFNFLSGVETFLKFEDVNKKYDGVIAVDCSVTSRLGACGTFLRGDKTFNIDHHISNSNYAKYNCVIDRPANCENIFLLLNVLGVKITNEIADVLLLGLTTDTGGFAHSNADEKTLECASKLMSFGGNLHIIMQKMFKNQTKSRAKLYARVMSKMGYYLDDQVAVITISRKDIDDCKAADDMTEGFIDFPMTVNTVEVAFSLLEMSDKHYKISMRSKGKVNVNEIASLYGGGGHVLASGATMNGYPQDIIDKLVYNVKQRL